MLVVFVLAAIFRRGSDFEVFGVHDPKNVEK
jgi:hypothetical protein